jgi:hypothetical protein
VDPIVVRVVDRFVEAEGAEPFEAVVARCGREHGRAGALRELDRGEADATRPAWISTVSPVVRCPNSNRQSSAVPNAIGTQATASMSAPSGIGHVTMAGTTTSSAWEPAIIVATTR